MGEYLKTLMIKKLNNPDFKIPYIPKSREINTKFMGLKKNIVKRDNVWKPKEIRH